MTSLPRGLRFIKKSFPLLVLLPLPLLLGAGFSCGSTYAARGACFTEVVDDGTLSPTAAGGSVAFAPEICVPTLQTLAARHGAPLYGRYGFVDAFNPTLRDSISLQHGRIVPGAGWYDTDMLAIDQGPILAMIENYRTGLVWRMMRANVHVRRGLERAGFSGGWLGNLNTIADSKPALK